MTVIVKITILRILFGGSDLFNFQQFLFDWWKKCNFNTLTSFLPISVSYWIDVLNSWRSELFLELCILKRGSAKDLLLPALDLPSCTKPQFYKLLHKYISYRSSWAKFNTVCFKYLIEIIWEVSMFTYPVTFLTNIQGEGLF